MFFAQKSYPQWNKKVAYADLTNEGKGILQQKVTNGMVRDGKLKTYADCSKAFQMSTFVQALWGGPFDDLYVAMLNGIYRRVNNVIEKIVGGNFMLGVFAYLNSQNTIVFSSPYAATYVYDNGEATKVSAVGLNSLVTFRDRYFGLRVDQIYFTKQGDATAWHGQISLPQQAKCLVATNDGIYVVGQDVYLLQFSDKEFDSKLTLVYKNLGQVVPGSVQSVGKGFYYLCADYALRYFNGSSVQTVMEFENISAKTDFVSSVVAGDKYYLNFDRYGAGTNSQLIVVDIPTGKLFTAYDISAKYIAAVGSDIYVSSSNEVFLISRGKYGPLHWESRPYGFGNDSAKKSLEKLLVDTASDITVTVTTETDSRVLQIKGSPHLQKIPLHGSFHRVSVTLDSESKAEIASLGIVANVLREEVN